MAKKYFLAIFLMAAAAYVIVLFSRERLQTVEGRVATSARRGMAWLSKYEGNFGDPGILWAINEINKNYCSSVELQNFVSERFREFENHPIDSAYKKLIADGDGKKPDVETIKTSGKKYDEGLLGALYCRETKPEKRQKAPENQGFSGYDLTHEFLAALWLKKNGCAPPEADKTIDAIAEQIANEENSAPFNDLFAERAAFLQYAGHKEKIQSEWIEKIIANQSNSGSWNNKTLFGKSDDPHTTALATWALAQWIDACPL